MTDEQQETQGTPGNFFAGMALSLVLIMFFAAGIQIGWNDGIRQLVFACGGYIDTIGYWTAYAIVVLLTVAAVVRTVMRAMLTAAGDKTQVVVAPIVRIGNE